MKTFLYDALLLISNEYAEFIKEDIKNRGNQRAINQYTVDMEFVTSYKSLKEAEMQTKISRQSISNVCRGKQYQTHGYIFKYAD